MINKNDRLVPDKTVLIVPNKGIPKEHINSLIEPLASRKKREWFNPHFYYCLPLNVGNRYGFIVKAERDFTAFWNGNPNPTDVLIKDNRGPEHHQIIDGHFGEGIITIQNPWHYRTAPGINLMTITPPNFPQHGIMHMTGVIETDNLRRDFTFNLKITKPNIYVEFKKGDPVGAFIPIPRYYADKFSLSYADEFFSEEEIDLEHKTGAEFGRQRAGEDQQKTHAAGRKYFEGIDAWGNEFPDHQR